MNRNFQSKYARFSANRNVSYFYSVFLSKFLTVVRKFIFIVFKFFSLGNAKQFDDGYANDGYANDEFAESDG